MADHHFLCGQIRALESKLLTTETVDRMINSDSLESAFKGMLELQYAEYIDEKTAPEDFAAIIDQGLFETKELIEKSTNDSVMNFLWGEFDLSNIKRSLKQNLMESRNEISTFDENNGYSRLGSLDQNALQELVWEGKSSDDFTLESLAAAVQKAESVFKNSKLWYDVENLLDQAFFDDLGRIAEESNSNFFKELYTKIVQIAQEQILGRVVIIEKRSVTETEWIHSEAGISFDSIKEIDSADRLSEIIPELKVSKDASLEELAPILESWEKNQNNALDNFIHAEAMGASDHLAVPFGYFKKRESNAHLLRFVLYSKSSGLSASEIKQSLDSTL